MSGARSLRTKDGERLSIGKMAIPESLKDVIRELDLDGTGEVNEQNLRDSLMVMKLLKEGLDTDGSGGVNTAEMEAGVELLTRLAKQRAMNSSELDYKHMPECIQGVMREWDADGSGKVSVGELAAAAQAFKKIQQEGRLMKKIILGLSIVILILMVGMFVLSLAAAEMAKESFVEGGKSTDKNGNVVATRSSDFEVCPDGTMASWGKCPVAGTGRRLEASVGDMLKTVSTKQKQPLASSLADAFFMALNEVSVFSDKGHTLRLTIHGFSRVPVANSRCGNVVHLYTAWNGRLTLDSTDLSFDKETEAAFLNAGFTLLTGGVSGRRLADEHGIDGFFSAVQGVLAAGWTCKDVPLPSLPPTFSQRLTVYVPCAVEGATGSSMDMCDSLHGGVVPGTGKLSRQHQLATMSKTARIRAQLSVDVPINATLFVKMEIDTVKSPSYELQVTRYGNHPGQQKVNFFDRRAAKDVQFQLIESYHGDGRFYCNSSGTGELSTQMREMQAEKSGVDRKMHFEFLDIVEEEGLFLRHFRMMPSNAFLKWMGAKLANERPKDAYYEYWDVAADLTPFRLLNPDGSLVVFSSVAGSASDADIEVKLAALGSAKWSALTQCTAEEQKYGEVMAPTLDMQVPMMLSPMSDLKKEDFAFYAKVNLDEHLEDASGNGWQSMVKRSGGSGPLAPFAQYAVRANDPLAVADVCADACAESLAALKAQTNADNSLELCDAPALTRAVQCMIDIASAKTSLCLKNNFMSNVNGVCTEAAADRRLHEENEDGQDLDYLSEEDDTEFQGSDVYLHRLGRLPSGRSSKVGETKKSQMQTLKDGTMSIDLDAFDAAQRAKIAEAIGVPSLVGGRVLFNASDHQPEQTVSAVLEANDKLGTVHARRLMLDMNCIQTGIGPGCIFKIGYPWRCNPATGTPKCDFGIAVLIQHGGPANGALTVAGSGCIPSWAFGVPKPLAGTVCIDGGIGVSRTGACGLPFSLFGWVAITAAVGLDLVIFSFNLASIRIEAGAAMEMYKYNCDERRRRRNFWGGRRRGNDQVCSTRCDFKVYAKITISVFIGRVWGMVQYWVKNKDFDLIVGADIYIWLIFTSWWETVAKVTIV